VTPAAEFPDTRWSQILQLRDPAGPGYAERLESLLRRYWNPAYHYLRAIRTLKVEDAEDLTQQFFAMLLSRGSLETLSPDRGSFRGFLKTALRRWAVSAERKEAARAPRDGARLFRFEEAEAQWKRVQERNLQPEEAFDREWVRGLLDDALARLEQDLKAEGKALPFEIFREYCLDVREPVSYDELARRHAVTADEVRSALRTVRQRGREILRAMLQDQLPPGESIDDELRFILSR
jgi:RNA polymerase sigma-70 factor (ECF subfamily)